VRTHASPDAPTRAQLLDAAERLLLESDYDRVSVRAINTAAGMNPAAVHYHFGSKENLVAALLEQRLAPRWQPRLAATTERGRPPTVAELADVVLTPLADLSADPTGRLHLHLLSRLVLARRDVSWTSRWFRTESWVDLLRAARPDLEPTQAARRWLLAFDLILLTFGTPLTTVAAPSADAVQTLRTFVIAGLDAP
jgi:AcrR family transcriptional regulator